MGPGAEFRRTLPELGFTSEGSCALLQGFRVLGVLGFRALGLGFRASGLGFMVLGLRV